MVVLRLSEKDALKISNVLQYGRRYFPYYTRKLIDELVEAITNQTED
jgi:hypothetical protein